MTHSGDLNIRHLFAAVNIAKLGSISRVAEVIHISQPALTHAMNKLETRLGHRIFDRQNNGVHVTPQGELFLSHVRDGLVRLAGAAQQLRQSAKLKPLVAPELHITHTQLRAFLAVLSAGGYTPAARALQFSQPSIHRAVRELQFFLGVTLFAASGPVLRAPDSVRQFGEQVQLAMATIQSGIDELAALDDPGVGRVALGSLPLVRTALLPSLLARFSGLYPKVSITVAEGQYAELLGGLRNGSIDMVFGALRASFAMPDLEQRLLFHDELFVVGRVEHPIAGQPAPPEVLRAYPWVAAAAGSPMRLVWESLFRDAGVELPQRRVECGSILLARELMREGNWLGLMSPHHFQLEEELGVLTRIGGAVPGSVRPIGMTLRHNWRPTAIQRVFLELAEEMGGLLPAQAGGPAIPD
jgi:LysR family transcriptional regulator, regulator for genes of the gallate degradation pathway